MSHPFPFPLPNFGAYCSSLQRVGVDPGFVMYTNEHAGSRQPAARLLPGAFADLARSYIDAPSDAGFQRLVEAGVLLDTEWERVTAHWEIIAFTGWEVLHASFNRLYGKSRLALVQMGGVEPDFDEPA